MDPEEPLETHAARAAGLGPLERLRRLLLLTIERGGEGLREGGMLVVVFGLLDDYLGDGRQGADWPWKCSSIGAILWVVGVAFEWALMEVRRR